MRVDTRNPENGQSDEKEHGKWNGTVNTQEFHGLMLNFLHDTEDLIPWGVWYSSIPQTFRRKSRHSSNELRLGFRL